MQHVQPGYRSGQDNIEPIQSTLFGLDYLGRLHHDDVVVLQPLGQMARAEADEAFARLALAPIFTQRIGPHFLARQANS
jgi:hypothetical protein